MKRSIFHAARLASVALMALGLVVSQQQVQSQQEGTVSTGQVSPNREPLLPSSDRTEQDRERLLSRTRVALEEVVLAIRKESRRTIQLPQDRLENLADNQDTARQIETLEAILQEASQIRSPEVSRALLRLMDAPSYSIRITALNWLAARPDVAEEALAIALKDGDRLVRIVAEQLLIERGATPQDLQDLKASLGKTDVILRQAVGALLGRLQQNQ